MALYIVALTGAKAGSKMRISEGFTIGRTSGDLVLENDPKVSGTHAKVIIDNKGQFILVDQGSSNGMILNERRVKKVALMPGVIFTIGAGQFRVIKDDSAFAHEVPGAKNVDPIEIPKVFAVPLNRGPQDWREKLEESWEQHAPMVSSPSEAQIIHAFSPAVVLDFIEGVQADQKITLGYGPRQAGFDHLDIDLQDPTIPDEAFEIKPGPSGAELVDLTQGQIFINNQVCSVTHLEEGDIISIGQTKIKVRYL